MLFNNVTQHNFRFLLLSLLLCILVLPLINGLNLVTTALLTQLSFFQVLLVGVWSLLGDPRLFRFGMGLTILSGILTLLYLVFPGFWLGIVIALLTLIFLLLSTYIAFLNVFASGQVDVNRLYGAACIYLMLAMIWSLLYMLIDLFSGQTLSNINTDNPFWEYLYFSFVTLTTLGYGDISPVSSATRVLAGFEALVGQFYLTILVAALVGVHVSQLDTVKKEEQ